MIGRPYEIFWFVEPINSVWPKNNIKLCMTTKPVGGQAADAVALVILASSKYYVTLNIFSVTFMMKILTALQGYCRK